MRLLDLILAALSGAIVVLLLFGAMSAASREAPAAISVAQGLREAPVRLLPAVPSKEPALSSVSEPAPTGELVAAAEGGVASWFNSYGPGLYAAVPSYRWGDPRYPIRVCRADAPGVCVTATVLDHCACPGPRIVDLSRDAFSRLAPPSVGLVRVTVETLDAAPTPPQTETLP